MLDKNFEVRTMTKDEVSFAVNWAAQEGWNPGLHDAETYYCADKNGFFIGLLNNEPIAAISAVKYNDEFGFMGFYIVKPEYRGKGYAAELRKISLDYLKGITIGLDGVTEQEENYTKSGFKRAYSNIRYQGAGGGEVQENEKLIELSSIPFENIALYDRPFFPTERTKFLKCWINQPDSTALGIMNNDKLSGYGVIRTCRSGHKIGPLFADTPKEAESLFLALKSKISPKETVYIDIPKINKSALSLVEKYNMEPSFETARMYKGEAPKLPIDKLFGVTSFEIG